MTFDLSDHALGSDQFYFVNLVGTGSVFHLKHVKKIMREMCFGVLECKRTDAALIHYSVPPNRYLHPSVKTPLPNCQLNFKN